MWFVPQMRNVHALLLYPMFSPPLQVGLGKRIPRSFPVVPMGLGEMGEHQGPGDNLQGSLQLLWAADRGFETSATPFVPCWCHLVTALGRWCRGRKEFPSVWIVPGRHQLSILAANKP